jgi:hypothetical protein
MTTIWIMATIEGWNVSSLNLILVPIQVFFKGWVSLPLDRACRFESLGLILGVEGFRSHPVLYLSTLRELPQCRN